MATGLKFAFDPQRGETPETLRKRREVANAIMARTASKMPRNIGEGLNSIGNALLYRQMTGGIDEAMEEGRKSGREKVFNALSAFSGIGGSPGEVDRAYSLGDGTPSAGESASYASERVSDAHENFSGDQEEFVQMLMPAAMKASQQTGVDPRIIVAQAAQETGWGKSAPGNNFFGIKSHGNGGGQNLKTHEYVNGKRVNVTDSFRAFESPEDSVMGYAQFIQENPRYQQFMQAEGLDAQLAALQESGYATDPNYASSVGAIARSLPMPELGAEEVQVASLDPSIGMPQANAGYFPGAPVATTERGQRVVDTLLGPDNLSGGAPMTMQQPGSAPSGAPNGGSNYAAERVRAAHGLGAAQNAGAPNRAPQPQGRPNFPVNAPTPMPRPSQFGGGIDPNNPATIPPMAGGTLGITEASRDIPVNAAQQQATSQQPVSQQQGSQGPSLQELIALSGDPWAMEQYGPLINTLLERELQSQDPMRQLEMERAQLELEQLRNPQADIPDSVRALDIRAQRAGLQPGTEEYQQFMATGGKTQDQSAATQRISRLTENLMATGDFVDPQQAQNIAIGIVDGRFKTDRNPVTRELQVVDMATGQIVYGGQGSQQGQPQAQGNALPAPQQPMAAGEQFGQQFPAASDSFGVGGSIASAVNTASDVMGAGPVYPEIQQTQSDFGVLRESLMNDIASAYNRQPPSWLMKEIRNLTPAAGSPFEGASGAQSKLNAIGRHLASELQATEQSLQRELTPKNRQELEARRAGLETGINRITSALEAFQAPEASTPPSEAVEVLRGDPSPEARREFDEVFGQGAAERVLRGQ